MIFILSIFVLAAEVIPDWYSIQIKKTGDRHTQDVWAIRIPSILVSCFIDRWVSGSNYWEAFAVISMFFIMCFNYALNWTRKKPWDHLGNNFTDKIERKINPYTALGLKVSGWVVTLIIYYL